MSRRKRSGYPRQHVCVFTACCRTIWRKRPRDRWRATQRAAFALYRLSPVTFRLNGYWTFKTT